MITQKFTIYIVILLLVVISSSVFAQEQLLGLRREKAVMLFSKLNYTYPDSADPALRFNKKNEIPTVIFRWGTKGIGSAKFDSLDRLDSFSYFFEPSEVHSEGTKTAEYSKGMTYSDRKKVIKELTLEFGFNPTVKAISKGSISFIWENNSYFVDFTTSPLTEKEPSVCAFRGYVKH
jgi:hypothetical protein